MTPVKAFLSVDLEGLPGIASVTMVSPEKTQFQRAVEVMTSVVKTTVEVLLREGFDRVVVADSHGLMTTIDYLKLPRGVSLIQGYPRPFSMVTGLDKTFNLVMFLGYHTGAGTTHGFLDHTFSGRVFHEVSVNGIRVSEYLVNALYASEQGVPTALLAGDHYLKLEVERHTPWVTFVEFKKGVSRYGAFFDSFDEVLENLRKGVEKAVERFKRGELRLLELNKPYELVVKLRDPLVADVVETDDRFQRVDAYTVKSKADYAKQLLNLIEAVALIGYGIDSLKTAIR